jgi:hypothetical protein
MGGVAPGTAGGAGPAHPKTRIAANTITAIYLMEIPPVRYIHEKFIYSISQPDNLTN